MGSRPPSSGAAAELGTCPAAVPAPRVPSQTALPWMRYVAVACVVGIIAGFCMGPGGSGVPGGCGAGAGAQGDQGAARRWFPKGVTRSHHGLAGEHPAVLGQVRAQELAPKARSESWPALPS